MINLMNMASVNIVGVLYTAGIWAVCAFVIFTIWSYRDRKWSK